MSRESHPSSARALAARGEKGATPGTSSFFGRPQLAASVCACAGDFCMV
jgi:hypothetical protein